MLRGLTTVSFYADDLDAASGWYAEVLGIQPYFSRPGYIEFRIGDSEDELGIIDRRFAPRPTAEPGGAVVYWHVDDLASVVSRLLALGAVEYEPVREHGPGFVTASVVDPFGNVLGVMENQHYLQTLAAPRP